jgi:hypothetical protein
MEINKSYLLKPRPHQHVCTEFRITHMTDCARTQRVSDNFVCLATSPVKFSNFYAVTYIGLTTAILRAGVTKMGIP